MTFVPLEGPAWGDEPCAGYDCPNVGQDDAPLELGWGVDARICEDCLDDFHADYYGTSWPQGDDTR